MHFKAVLAIGMMCALAARPAVAALLEPAQCEAAKSEQAKLVSAGIDNDMQRGPEWARAHLSPDRLRQIARFIELQETVLFRCPRPKPPTVTPAAVSPDPDQAGTPKKERKPKKARPEAAQGSETEQGSPEAVAKPKKKQKSTAASKPDDAYRTPMTAHPLLPDP